MTSSRNNPAKAFQASYPGLNTIKWQNVAAAIHNLVNQAKILSLNGERITSLKAINTLTDSVSILQLNSEFQTKFNSDEQA
jgi:hypothetical protein